MKETLLDSLLAALVLLLFLVWRTPVHSVTHVRETFHGHVLRDEWVTDYAMPENREYSPGDESFDVLTNLFSR